MFTGIITDIGTIRGVERRGDLRVVISCGYDVDDIDIGASIACSGVCLTVVGKGKDGGNWFAVDVSHETESCTAQGQWSKGRRLNLERPLKVGDEMGGHIVTGHVDGIGEIVSAHTDGDSTRLEIAAPADIAPYLAPKGSITLDGASLTVNDVRDDEGGTRFTLNIIPHTARVTTLADAAPGRAVNLEIDILARYLARFEQVAARRGQD